MSRPPDAHTDVRPVTVPAGRASLAGDLGLPPVTLGMVLFAHGSGSGRYSPRNRFVARVLQHAGLATLLVDLLTSEEEREDAVTAALRFDIGLLAERLVHVTDWLGAQAEARGRPIGYFGASTGAAAALVAAARRPTVIAAVVSRGGRPDLAHPVLAQVRAPTLLIVGEHDDAVLSANRDAMRHLSGERELAVVPGATHLFEEPGALDAVARLAEQWFTGHLTPGRT